MYAEKFGSQFAIQIFIALFEDTILYLKNHPLPTVLKSGSKTGLYIII